MGHDVDEFRSELRDTKIPGYAWAIALLAITGAAGLLLAIPGPAATGCVSHKGCFIVPHAPLYCAGAAVLAGVALSTWLGRVPRGWVVGWSGTVAALAAFALVSLPLLPLLSRAEGLRSLFLGSLLVFLPLWLLGTGMGLLASLLPHPLPRSSASIPVVHDPRPPWLLEIGSVLAVLDGNRERALGHSETQLVAELVFTLEGDHDAPRELLPHVARLRAMLATAGRPSRDALRDELWRAASIASHAHPYRVD